MAEVAYELQVMKAAQVEAMDAQKQSFQTELDRVKEKLELCEVKTGTLESEIRSLKIRKPAQSKRLGQSAPVPNKGPITSISKPEEGEIGQGQSQGNINSTPTTTGSSTQPNIEKGNYATVAAFKARAKS